MSAADAGQWTLLLGLSFIASAAWFYRREMKRLEER